MSTEHIVIRGLAVHHPEESVSQNVLFEQYKSKGIDVANLLSYLGKDSRYLSSEPDETTLTMAIKSSKKVLEQEGLKGEDMDMIVFASGVHEYHIPPDSCFLHQAVEGKTNCLVYDMNANCAGMVVAVDQAYKAMKANPSLQYALVVGSERMIQYTKKTDVVNTCNFGDASCAVILERTSEEERGFARSAYATVTSVADRMQLPYQGMSKLFNDASSSLEERKIWMHPEYNSLESIPYAIDNIVSLATAEGINVQDIKGFFVSQATLKLRELLSQGLKVSEDKITFIGREFGYTGVSSPFIAMHHAVRVGKLRRRDWFILWSVGAGSTSCVILGRY